MKIKSSVLAAALLFAAFGASAQQERSFIRQGNALYKEGKYTESGAKYAEALKKNPSSAEAAFNLANVAYKQGQWAVADSVFTPLAEQLGADAWYNAGNANFKKRDFDAAIERYKAALRLNPSDREAKFNLAYAQKMKQEQEGGGGGQNQQQDQQRQDQNQQQNQQDQQQDKQDKPQDSKQDQQPQQPKDQSKADAERMLKAIQAAEDKTKEKVEAQQKAAPQRRSGKDW